MEFDECFEEECEGALCEKCDGPLPVPHLVIPLSEPIGLAVCSEACARR